MAERRRPARVAVLAVVAALAVVLAGLVALRDGEPGGHEAVARTRPVAPAGVALGVVANTQDTAAGSEQDAAAALGVGLLREELRWPDVEPRPGRFDDRRYDALTAKAARRGLRILPLLFQSPRWLTPEPNTLPPSLPRWSRFVRHVVGRYGPGGAFWRAHPELDGRLAMRTWEVWNEPYLPAFAAGGVDPAAYARLVRATIAAGRLGAPGARFLAAVETDYEAADGSHRDWADDLFAADPGLGRLLGGVAIHPYDEGSPLAPPDGDALRFARTERLLRTVRAAGVRGARPLWLTEFGWSTCATRPPCVSRAEQAAYVDQALSRVDRPPLRGQVAALVLYRLRDITGDGPADTQADFGLLTAAGTPKPAWRVLHAAALSARRTSPDGPAGG